MIVEKVDSKELWHFLKQVCCANPKEAKRIILFNEKDLEKAFKLILYSRQEIDTIK